jgi:hypothetical protein
MEITKHAIKRFKKRVKNIPLKEIIKNCYLSHELEKSKDNKVELVKVYRYKTIALLVKGKTIVTAINLQEEINKAIDFFKKNKNEHIIGIKDNNHNGYNLTTCIQKDNDGNCGRYCNCDCTHWSYSFELELFSKKEIDMLEEI